MQENIRTEYESTLFAEKKNKTEKLQYQKYQMHKGTFEPGVKSKSTKQFHKDKTQLFNAYIATVVTNQDRKQTKNCTTPGRKVGSRECKVLVYNGPQS